MAEDRDPLFREIDEELRREQLQKLWNEYGTYLILGVVVLLAGVGGFKWIETRRAAEAQAAGARYESVVGLVEQGKTDAARQEFKAIADAGPAGYAALAQLELAGSALRSGRTEEALAIYRGLAEDGRADPLLKDYARLQAASLTLDTASWTEMQNRLNPLLGDKSAWRYSARELLGLAAVKAGEAEEARKVFTELLSDQKVPASIQQRARLIMAMLTAADEAKAGSTGGQPAPAGSGAGGAPAKAQ